MYVGLDVHKGYCYYAMVDGRGTVVKKDRFRTTGEELEEFASPLPEGGQVASKHPLRAASSMSSSMSRE